MEKKQTWEEIQKQYDGEWVLLDEYEWPESAEYPQAGIVRIHAKQRAEFDRLISTREAGFDSALVFVGGPERAADTVTTRGYSRVEFGVS
jgi:hypothetical protein